MRNDIIREYDARSIPFQRGKYHVAFVTAAYHQLIPFVQIRLCRKQMLVWDGSQRLSDDYALNDIFQIILARKHSRQKLLGKKIKRKVG